MDPLSGVLGAAGFILGIAADRFATRWPEHDEEHPPGRRVDWRTAVVAFGAWFVTLIVGLATDLDQRLLPDLLTLPVIPVALVYALTGSNPLVGPDIVPAVLAAVVIPAALYLPSIPFGAGAFGLGDVKLLAGVGLLVGGERALGSVVFALVLSGIVLITLLATRRIGRRTYVPFGPFFIIGALWAVLIRP
jgi:leader peptidase (prepilin peptidase)/N-methyltransferase